jgi:putative membrane protein
MRVLISVPLLILLIMFALSNRQPVAIRLWPTDFSAEAPLSLTVLAGMAIAFLLGGILVWFSVLVQRRRARRAEAEARLLAEQIAELKARLARVEMNATPLPPPA